ncbi:DUF2867 domain-containing protein [Acidiphilium sp.]|uniref:DUF2867 domain-containing protein n=1 Tax=Acidiphilium sp. TaxID=527 RepID=UPI003D01FE89
MNTHPDPQPRPVLVFGASGYIGSNLVPALVRAGRPVRACARSRAVLESRSWQEVELVEADALRPETLDAALRGVGVAYYLVHSMAAGRDFGRIDIVAAGHFADAAARAGVERIIYLGGLVPPDAASEHLLSRRATGDRLRAGTVPVTEIRAGVIVGPGSAAYEVIRDLVNALPFMLAPKWIQSRSAPIALSNLLYYLIHVADLAQTAGAILDAAGPDFLSYEAMMRQFGEIVGRHPRILRVPLLTPRLSSYWLGLVTTVPTSIARALVAGLGHDIPADDAALRQLVPQPLLGYRDSVVAALVAERQHAVAARWSEGLFMYRNYRQDHAFYAKRAGASAITTASPQALWHVVTAIGGNTGYYYADVLWEIRAVMDWLAGGSALAKGRRDPTELRLGDRIDSWTVMALEPERLLTLQFGMRAPGSGALEFVITPHEHGRTTLTITAYWHPQGIWGLSYWYAFVPAHMFIFKGMTAAITRRAELLERTAAARAVPD